MPSVEESVATIKAELKYLKEQGALDESAYRDIESLLPRPAPKPVESSNMSQNLEVVEALYAFAPQQEGDLALQPNDRIEILEKLSPEWYKGRCNGKVGVFPSNYVKPVEKREMVVNRPIPAPVPTPPQYAAYTPPPAQQQQQQQQPTQPFPPQFSGYYQQPPQQQMQPYVQQYPQAQVVQQQPVPQQQGSGSGGSDALKKFGSKLGNAAIFGAGATIGSDLVNSIF